MQGGMTMTMCDNARKGTKSMQMQNQRRRQNETMIDDRRGDEKEVEVDKYSSKDSKKKRDPNGD